ncbi:MAG: hypothetical protein WBA16_00915 [Nonlabens sp.]
MKFEDFTPINVIVPDSRSTISTIYTKARKHKRGNLVTIAVLAATTAILIGYAVYVGSLRFNLFTTGLSFIISTVAGRLLYEVYSIVQFDKLDPAASSADFKLEVTAYYKNRLKFNNWITPLLLTIYWTGFVMLIPTLQEFLSSGLFWYICISSFPIAAVMIWLISAQIKKEYCLLKLWSDGKF